MPTSMPTSTPSPSLSVATAGFAGLLAALVVGCSGIEKAPPRPTSAGMGERSRADLSPIMRGTVHAETEVVGFRDVVVRGYGFVVGLKGTGGRIMLDPIRGHMLAEMTRRGVGSAGFRSELSPEALLNSMDTAVVVVEGVIPPGAPKGTAFDVRVAVLPDSDVTSLEGGVLWTTELRPVTRPGLPPVGSRQASSLAEARGPIFVNPFFEQRPARPDPAPSTEGDEADEAGTDVGSQPDPEPPTPPSPTSGVMNRLTGRILGGGSTTKDMPLKLRLLTPSHNRVSLIQQVINSSFPEEPGQRAPTARGENDESIELTVPPSYHDRTAEFVQLIRHTSMRYMAVETTVNYVKRMVIEYPHQADAASWRFQALGPRVLPAIRDFYTYAEEGPRLAALRAGARLADPTTIPPLINLAKTGTDSVRQDAVRLLGDMPLTPQAHQALRDLLDDDNVDVQIAAYEALRKHPRSPHLRRFVIDGKFGIDLVDSARSLIYVTQLDEPRIVLFGADLAIDRPSTVFLWANRFMLRGDLDREKIQVRYRDESAPEGSTFDVSPSLVEFIAFLGHTTTIEAPAAGLGLTYSDVVGIVQAVHSRGYIDARFVPEQDRILAAIVARESDFVSEERPEFEGDEIPPDVLQPYGGSGRSEFDLPAEGLGSPDETVEVPGLEIDRGAGGPNTPDRSRAGTGGG